MITGLLTFALLWLVAGYIVCMLEKRWPLDGPNAGTDSSPFFGIMLGGPLSLMLYIIIKLVQSAPRERLRNTVAKLNEGRWVL